MGGSSFLSGIKKRPGRGGPRLGVNNHDETTRDGRERLPNHKMLFVKPVTSKEIDVVVNDMADVVAEALNRALQPDLDRSEWA